MKRSMTRRSFVAAGMSLTVLGVAGCRTTHKSARVTGDNLSFERKLAKTYGPRPDETFPLPAVKLSRLSEEFRRQHVLYDTNERPGTIIVDTEAFHLFLVEHDGTAIRYGVGLGRQGFEWSGRAKVGWKRPWPRWTPPDEMIAREPELEKWSVRNGGMPPGLKNPLGARALYIFEGKVDTLYRVHGTYETHTIGKAVSSGCVRMINHDVIDLYERVKLGAPILVA